MGALPKEKVGAGDKWESKDSLSMPGMNQFKVSLKAKNELEKFEDGGKTAVITTKLSVGTVADESEDPGANMFNLKAKMTGEGEGKTKYNVEAGRAAHSQNKVKVKITATMDNPQGGDALEFKAVLSIEQENTIE